MEASRICVPGQRLCRVDDMHVPGNGTYASDGFIYSSILGYWNERVNSESKEKVIDVLNSYAQTVIPFINAIVTARVTNINPRYCKCEILTVGDKPLSDFYRGLIKKEDVRTTEKDRVELYKCFRPGDIIIARVISLGDAQSYILSTAENELGVIIGMSQDGIKMVPTSWCKMQCPKTLNEEFRKVAKVQKEYIRIAEHFF
ncbi:exosome complex component CSL4-like [Biomphalaria glabrata]|uniref:Exosome complex component CSL4-like n=1 Tax=Biomphalaria glabrata TaxID=6526 RepID=A0A9U8EI00_BIOGL|nr:exosome complex component CSL4-like [Biomphalaria glabrata]